MGADIVQVQYEALEAVARRFGKQAEAHLALQQTVRARLEPLRGGGWQGKGASAFFAEMDGKINPALGRLVAALRAAENATLQMSALLRQAEEDAARPFRGKTESVDLTDPGVASVKDASRGWPILSDLLSYSPKYKRFTGSISVDGISPSDVDQGRLSDCYLMAALATIAQQHPEVIWNAIRDNGDGTYTVTFYQEGKPVRITVDADFPVVQDADGNPTDIPAFAGTGSDPAELWPMIIEKAYTQLKGDNYTDIEWGLPDHAVTTLTGKPAERLEMPVPADQMQSTLEDLQDRLANGEYVTAGTRRGYPFEDMEKWPNNVSPSHAYSVERVDAQAGLIYLRNPLGDQYTVQPMTLNEFNKYYNYVAANH